MYCSDSCQCERRLEKLGEEPAVRYYKRWNWGTEIETNTQLSQLESRIQVLTPGNFPTLIIGSLNYFLNSRPDIKDVETTWKQQYICK